MRPLSGLQEILVATREESGVLCFPSRRGLIPRVSLECNPEIPISLEMNIRSWTHDSMRSLWPSVSRAQPPAFPRNSKGSLGFPGRHKRKPEIPVVSRESRRNSRKTAWFPRLRKMRALPATASPGKSLDPPGSAKRHLTPFRRPPKVPRHAGFPRGEHRGSRHRFL